MSLEEMRGSTSRSALILGMTDTSQVGFQQARAPAAARSSVPAGAEVLPDTGDGGGGGGDEDGVDTDPETGLSGADLEAFRQMQTGDPGPGEEEPAPDAEGEGDDEGVDATGEEGDPATPESAPLEREKTPAEQAAEAAGKRQPPKTVNFSKHQRELKKIKDQAEAFRQQAEKERTDRIKLNERLNIINEAIAAQQAAAAAAPAADADPNAPPENPFEEEDIDPTVDYAASVLQERRRNRYAYEQTQQTQTTVAETREDQALRQTFERDFQQVASTPEGKDLPAAYQFLKDSRLTQICLSEFDKDPNDPNEQFTQAEVKKMVEIFNAEEKWLVGNAIRNRKSPAAAIMKQARVYGFKPPAPAAPAPAPRAGTPPARTNGARPPAVAATPPAPAAAPSAADQLAELEAAQDAGRSLSDGGGVPPGGLSAEMLLRLSDEEFAEFAESMPHQLNALLGRVQT